MKRLHELLNLWDLSEESSLATKQARLLGLSSAGFGRWEDHTGKITHVTKNGQLVPVAKQTVIDAKSFDWANVLDNLIKDAEKNDRPHILIDTKDPREVELANALTLWTNGSISTVRNVTNFNEVHSDKAVENSTLMAKENYSPDGTPKEFESKLRDGTSIKQWKPWSTPNTKQAYKKANVIMKKLANAKWVGEDESLYRGMVLSANEASKLIVGEEFNVGEIASFSKDYKSTKQFAVPEHDGGSYVSVILTIKAGRIKRGTPIHEVSNYVSEQEVVSSGKHVITDIHKGVSSYMSLGIEYPVLHVGVEQV